MKVKIINKKGLTWKFRSVKAASPYIKKECRKDYDIVDGIRVYDSRLYYGNMPCKFSSKEYEAFNNSRGVT